MLVKREAQLLSSRLALFAISDGSNVTARAFTRREEEDEQSHSIRGYLPCWFHSFFGSVQRGVAVLSLPVLADQRTTKIWLFLSVCLPVFLSVQTINEIHSESAREVHIRQWFEVCFFLSLQFRRSTKIQSVALCCACAVIWGRLILNKQTSITKRWRNQCN